MEPWSDVCHLEWRDDDTYYAYYRSDDLVGVGWSINSYNRTPYLGQKVHRDRATWTGTYWEPQKHPEKFLRECQARFPKWKTVPVVDGLQGYRYAVEQFAGRRALFLPLPLRTDADPGIIGDKYYVLHTSDEKWVVLPDAANSDDELNLLLQKEIDDYHARLRSEGATLLEKPL